jgi:hypothetical protein
MRGIVSVSNPHMRHDPSLTRYHTYLSLFTRVGWGVNTCCQESLATGQEEGNCEMRRLDTMILLMISFL